MIIGIALWSYGMRNDPRARPSNTGRVLRLSDMFYDHKTGAVSYEHWLMRVGLTSGGGFRMGRD